ncbi:hypothetical protein K432DRAFT_418238 [Lepidopterella palustris CBS 459.81]|uniref:CUE domain-containing protein n=1 Tax=Lepidopterella palustris CBS 459.81 TaxID=1314670 RepID=A0A8E2E6F7_9PEZI|nr:hypothetical protein K432DRAFT_418238 [Lepidopterella palustris CBS 459.81]
MSEKPTEKASKIGIASGAESPTTARPLDFDDELQDNSAAPHENLMSAPPPAKSPKPRVSFQDEEAPPPKPPRPMSPQAQAENTLMEAFPGIDSKIVKAVLVASGGKVEPAFNALLSMSDPDFKEEEAPPPKPPRPTQPRSQLEADELYARQLAQHYQSTSQGYGSRERGEPPMPRRRQDTGLKPNELYGDKEHSFFDDDLPVIKENVRKGFIETQSKVNKWITDFRKKLDGDEEEEGDVAQPSSSRPSRQNYGPSQSDQLYGIRKSAEHTRRSGDRERYDADNRVLGDDFEALELRDDETTSPPLSHRPLANPDLFKPTPVAPQGGPVDEVEALYRNPTPSHGKTKKWQPLTSVAPHPEIEDHDPFSLGDSDEDEAKTKDIKAEDTERLKKMASESEAGKKEGEEGKILKPTERSGSMGTRDQVAEDMLKGGK